MYLMSGIRILIVVFLSSAASWAGEVAWVRDFDTALKQAAEQKKFVVLDMSASWCGYCRKMAREVYPDPEFVEFSRSQVFFRVFADTDPQGKELAIRFRIRGFPTIVILNSQGQEVDRLVGARDKDTLIQGIRDITGRVASSRP
jgi:thiol:disulfide interchange protein